MNAHKVASPSLTAAELLSPGKLSVNLGADNSRLRTRNAQETSQHAPTAPVNQNAPGQPQAAAMGVMITGVISAPKDPPL